MSYQSEWLNVTHPRTLAGRSGKGTGGEKSKGKVVLFHATRELLQEVKSSRKNFRPLLQQTTTWRSAGTHPWKCKAYGHISSRFKSKASSSPIPAASAQPRLKHCPIVLSQTKPACSEMERRRSLGSTLTGARSCRDDGARIEDAGLKAAAPSTFPGILNSDQGWPSKWRLPCGRWKIGGLCYPTFP
jgi:hypothetical protein